MRRHNGVRGQQKQDAADVKAQIRQLKAALPKIPLRQRVIIQKHLSNLARLKNPAVGKTAVGILQRQADRALQHKTSIRDAIRNQAAKARKLPAEKRDLGVAQLIVAKQLNEIGEFAAAAKALKTAANIIKMQGFMSVHEQVKVTTENIATQQQLGNLDETQANTLRQQLNQAQQIGLQKGPTKGMKALLKVQQQFSDLVAANLIATGTEVSAEIEPQNANADEVPQSAPAARSHQDQQAQQPSSANNANPIVLLQRGAAPPPGPNNNSNQVNPARPAKPRGAKLTKADKLNRFWGKTTGSRIGKSALMRGTVGFFKGLLGYSMTKRYYMKGRGSTAWQRKGNTGFYTRYNRADVAAGKKDAIADRHHNRGAQLGAAITGIATVGIYPGVTALVGLLAGKLSRVHSTPQARVEKFSGAPIERMKKIRAATHGGVTALAQETNDVARALQLLENNRPTHQNRLPRTSDMKSTKMLHSIAKKGFFVENYEMMIAADFVKQHPTAANFRYVMNRYIPAGSEREVNLSSGQRNTYKRLNAVAQNIGDDNLASIFDVDPQLRANYESNLDDADAAAQFRAAIEAKIDQLDGLSAREKTLLKSDIVKASGDYPRNIGDLLTAASIECDTIARDSFGTYLNDAQSEASAPVAWATNPLKKATF